MTDAKLARLRGSRNVYMRHLKNMEEEITGLLKEFSASDEEVNRLKNLRKGFSDRMIEINKFDNEILQLLSNEECENELESTLIRDDLFRQYLVDMDSILEKATLQSQISRTEVSSTKIVENTKVKLPELTITKFDGNIVNWQGFWDQFDSSINSRQSISDIDKFNYLKSLLCDSACETISGLTLNSANYKEAIQLLQKRYGNTQVLINAHMKNFVQLQQVQNDDVEGLRRLYNQVETSVRNLKTLKVDTSSYGCLLVPLLNEKIPSEISIMLARKFKDDIWTLDEMIEIIQQELAAKERCTFETDGEFSLQNLQINTSKEQRCVYCDKPHKSSQCFKVRDTKARKQVLLKERRCFVCLQKGHISKTCSSSYKCFKCQKRHNISLCDGEKKMEHLGTPATETQTTSADSNNNVLLQTAQAEITDLNLRNRNKVRMLFDTGSQRTYVTSKCRDQMKLPTIRTESIMIKTFGNETSSIKDIDIVAVRVICPEGKDVVLECLVVPTICSDLTSHHTINVAKRHDHLKGLTLADRCVGGKSRVNILVGLDYYYQFVIGSVRRGRVNEPIALESSLGWILSGSFCDDSTHNNLITSCFRVQNVGTPVDLFSLTENEESVSSALRRFWEVDSIGILTPEDDVYSKFKSELTFNGTRYVTKLPVKPDIKALSSNRISAEQRLSSLNKKLQCDPKLRNDYSKVINEYIRDGIIEVASEKDEECYYMPHRAVLRHDKETTKTRVVFDASSHVPEELSLNDLLYAGPCLLPFLYDILLRFCIGKIGLVSDIKQAFLQIEIAEQHRDYLRFLWYLNPDDKYPTIFRFKRVTFGINCGPFLLNGTIVTHLQKAINQGIDVESLKRLLRDLYVDDSTTSMDDENDAFRFYETSKKHLQQAGFELHKWQTNNPNVREKIDQHEADSRHDTSDEKCHHKSVIKVLGVSWDVDSDCFVFDFSEMVPFAEGLSVTKRSILRISAMFFDPLGLISPVVLQFKLLFKRLCCIKSDWDDQVPPDVSSEFKSLLVDLSACHRISIDRHVFHSEGIVKSVEAHGFCDSSGVAYGCVIYIRIVTETSSFVRLWTAKTRLAPMKETNIPRLELLSCLLLSKLMNSMLKSTESVVKFHRILCWSDSQIALWWIRQTNKEWKPYVENRVTKIRKFVAPSVWRYVRSESNPADIVTRKCSVDELLKSGIWFHGPEFLRLSEDQWEVVPVDIVGPVDATAELRAKSNVSLLSGNWECGIGSLVKAERFSKIEKLLRVSAYILRFITNLKAAVSKSAVTMSEITHSELSYVENLWLRYEQSFVKSSCEFPKTKQNLNLFEDKDGLLRSRTRIAGVEDIDFNRRCPILLLKRSHFTNLLIWRAHKEVAHLGIESTLNQLRGTFWLIQGRQVVKSLLKTCVVCKSVQGKTFATPPSNNLPEFRVKCEYAFENVGLDFAGPLYAKNIYSTTSAMHKCYVLLFTCAATRAIHLELTPDQGLPSLILALKRFISRRGHCRLFISDNFSSFKSNELQQFMTSNSINWQFILERAPWWGGFYERYVKVVKDALKKNVGKASLSFYELSTVLCEVENAINSRPLTYLGTENLQEALTPYHLIYGRNINSSRHIGGTLADPESEQLLSRVRHVGVVIKHFLTRLQNEYVTNLMEFHRYRKQNGAIVQLEVDDLVLLKEDVVPRMLWRRGRVTKLITGSDGVARGAEVLTFQKGNKLKAITLRRPVQHLVPLEVSKPKVTDVTEKPDDPELIPQRRQRRTAAVTGELIRKMRN